MQAWWTVHWGWKTVALLYRLYDLEKAKQMEPLVSAFSIILTPNPLVSVFRISINSNPNSLESAFSISVTLIPNPLVSVFSITLTLNLSLGCLIISRLPTAACHALRNKGPNQIWWLCVIFATVNGNMSTQSRTSRLEVATLMSFEQ